MTEYRGPEEGLAALGQQLGLPVTVIDNAYFFAERAVFAAPRRSHRGNPACAAGFDERCVRHCRYAMNSRCLAEPGPFLAICWKGLAQVVTPLRYGSVHYGMLYTGLWRGAEPPPELPPGVPEEFRVEYAKLPPVPEPEALARLFALCGLCGDGVVMRLWKERLLDTVPDERGARIAAFLREHAPEPVGLEDLAAELGLSRSRTSFVVKRLFDKSFSRLLQEARVERAGHYLAASAAKLRDIARECGFSDEFHLSRVFRRQAGISPSEFRRHRQIPAKKPSFE